MARWKRSGMIVGAIVVAAIAAVAVVVTARPRKEDVVVDPTVPRPGGDPAVTAPPPIDNAPVEPGYHTVGWYTYQGPSDHPFWIRVDAGPPREAYAGLATERPWKWTVIEGSYDSAGTWTNGAMIATGNWDALQVAIDIDQFIGLGGSHDDLLALITARVASDKIDEMFEDE